MCRKKKRSDSQEMSNNSPTSEQGLEEKCARTVKNSQLYVPVASNQWPIVYRSDYNISFWGMEKLHPFDAGKWGKIYKYLKEAGGGFCVYADISLALKFLFCQDLIKKALIVDLDAHQGNGHERDFTDDPRVYIFDMYNAYIYPGDSKAKAGISRSLSLRPGTDTARYLEMLRRELPAAIQEAQPDILFYNAGTDCLEGDPLGALDISSEGIIERDSIVFQQAKLNHLPIVMVTSGGYQRNNARIIADSILNLHRLKLIWGPQDQNP